MNELELIRELKNGSEKAFETIYSMYFKRLYAYSLRFTKSSEDAEEIVQDVFLRLWNMRDHIHQEETLRSLLFILSKHYLIDSFHKTINSIVYEDYLDWRDKLLEENSFNHLEYKEFVAGIRELLKKLPVTQREVIELSRLEQLSNKEIAERLSLSEQTVKNQLSIGLKAFRKILDSSPLLLLLYVKYVFSQYFWF